jgi:hypothetical protein
MSNEKMRQDFEAWIEENSMFPIDGPRAAGYWSAWQASRAALCVELPIEFCNGTMNADRVRSAIESTGVRVK